MRKSLFLCLLASVLLTGPAIAEPTHTVEWYQQHPTERAAMLQACQNDPGGIGKTPNCINARHAAYMLEASKTGGLNLKPLTGDEIMRRIDERRRAAVNAR